MPKLRKRNAVRPSGITKRQTVSLADVRMSAMRPFAYGRSRPRSQQRMAPLTLAAVHRPASETLPCAPSFGGMAAEIVARVISTVPSPQWGQQYSSAWPPHLLCRGALFNLSEKLTAALTALKSLYAGEVVVSEERRDERHQLPALWARWWTLICWWFNQVDGRNSIVKLTVGVRAVLVSQNLHITGIIANGS